MNAAEFDPMATSLVVDPYPTFEEMRRSEPVHFNGALGSWMLFNHRDVLSFHHDRTLRHLYEQGQRVLRGDHVVDELYFKVFRQMLFVLDDPGHQRVRALFARSFTAKQIRNLEPSVRQIAESLIDAVIDRGAMDLIAEYANPLPVRVIGDLIGVPKTDQLWVAEQTAALNQVLGFLPLEDAVAQHANAAIAGLCDYFGDLADNKRAWLAVHPNTVAYRLRRAAELLGHDLNRRAAEVEVALTIAPLLGHQSLD